MPSLSIKIVLTLHLYLVPRRKNIFDKVEILSYPHNLQYYNTNKLRGNTPAAQESFAQGRNLFLYRYYQGYRCRSPPGSLNSIQFKLPGGILHE